MAANVMQYLLGILHGLKGPLEM